MLISHILVSQKYEAEDVLRKLSEGKSFADLATRYSTCSSAKQGGSLGDVALNRLDATFAEAAEKLKPGETSPIVRTRFGYHIIFRG